MVKRLFDITLSFVALFFLWPLLLLLFMAAWIDTGLPGLFLQDRVGRHGKLFKILKVRTMNSDHEVTPLGKLLRRSKFDELPQLCNVLAGQMSLVGPRPDIQGYYDVLQGEERDLLQLRPGITGPASLKYSNEDDLLAQQADPKKYNDEVIFPDKVRINMLYMKKQTLMMDIKILLLTFVRKNNN